MDTDGVEPSAGGSPGAGGGRARLLLHLHGAPGPPAPASTRGARLRSHRLRLIVGCPVAAALDAESAGEGATAGQPVQLHPEEETLRRYARQRRESKPVSHFAKCVRLRRFQVAPFSVSPTHDLSRQDKFPSVYSTVSLEPLSLQLFRGHLLFQREKSNAAAALFFPRRHAASQSKLYTLQSVYPLRRPFLRNV